MSSIWSVFTGSKSSPSSSSSSSDPPQPSSFLSDAASQSQPSTFQSSSYTPSTSDSSASSFLQIDPTQLHPLAGLDRDALEYLTLEEAALSASASAGHSVLPSRGWSDDLCYGTGVTYLSALSLGGAWGMAEGLRRTGVRDPPRLRLNAVLNGATRRGPFLANGAGVVALVYNGVNSSVGAIRGAHDGWNSVGSGFVAGAVFKCTRGVRAMGISGGIVAGIAGVWTVSSGFWDS